MEDSITKLMEDVFVAPPLRTQNDQVVSRDASSLCSATSFSFR